MKIKELHLRNIASIESADIDFENGLNDSITGAPASIFLISGDTGAGKSVILDGISMALYKTTPRIKDVANVKDNKYSGTEGELFNINSIEQYTRLGISEKESCYSEVVFEGNDGRTYRARLDLSLMLGNTDASGKRPLKHRTPAWTCQIDNGEVQKVDNKTGQPIIDAIGLSYEQFGRMAMLAQGQFATFLTGSKTERESILEQLTNTSNFSAYGEAIKNIYGRAKSGLVTAQNIYNTEKAHPLGEEKVAELKSTLKSLEKENQKLEKDKTDASQTLRLVDDARKQNEQLKEKQRELKAAEEVVSSDKYKSNKSLYEDWDASDAARKDIKDILDAEGKKTSAEEKLESAKKQYSVLSEDILFRESERDKKDEELVGLNDWLANRNDCSELFANAGTINVKMEQYGKNNADTIKAQGSLDEAKLSTTSLTESLNKAKKKVGFASLKVQGAQNAIDKLTEKRKALNPDQINEDIRLANERKSKIDNFEGLKRNYDALTAGVKEDKKTLTAERQELLKQKSLTDNMSQKYDTAKKEHEVSRNRMQTMQMSVEETLTELRKRLHDEHTDTCPLCGQHIDVLHIDEDFKNILSPLQTEELSAKQKLAKAEKDYNDAKTKYDNLEGSVQAKEKVLADRESELEQSGKSLRNAALELGFDTNASYDKQVKSAKSELKTSLHKLEEQQKSAETLQNDINKLLLEKKPLDKNLSDAEKERTEADNAVVQNSKDITGWKNKLSELEEERNGLVEYLAPMLDGKYSDWRNDCTTVREKLAKDSKEYLDKAKAVDDLRNTIGKMSDSIKLLKGMEAKILNNHNEWKGGSEQKEYRCNNIMDEWTKLYGDIKQFETTIKECDARIHDARSGLDTFYSAAEGRNEASLKALLGKEREVDEARKFVGDADSELKSRDDAVKTLKTQISNLLAELKVKDIDELPDSEGLNTKVAELYRRIRENAEDIGGITNQLEVDDANVKKLNKAKASLDKAQEVHAKWERINKYFGGTRFRTLVQTYILRPLLNNANMYLEQITDRYTLTCSEENEQLSILVLDRYNKDQVRSVTVLSGGERFMISLALSLALSSLNRPDLNVNILFIDEGFGTLDEKSLFSVMSTLEKLQEIAGQTDRRVGIISHREELDEIPVQIQVKKKGEGRSRVEIVSK